MNKKSKEKGSISNIISLEFLGYDFAKWSAALPMLVFFRPKIFYPFGKPNKKGKLIISSNHIGALDWVRIGFVFPFRRHWTLTRVECFNTKFNTFIFNSLKCLPVDRENFSMDTYHRIPELLKRGKIVLFFSEGRVNFKNNDVQDFKMGTVFFSVMNDTPIIPIYLVKTDNYLTQRCHIVVGKEFNPKDYCEGIPSIADIARINEELRKKECELGQWHDSYMKSKKINKL